MSRSIGIGIDEQNLVRIGNEQYMFRKTAQRVYEYYPIQSPIRAGKETDIYRRALYM